MRLKVDTMNVKRLTLIVCAISLGVSLGTPSVFAANDTSEDKNPSTANDSPSSFNELNPSHERGASFTPILTPPVAAPMTVTPVVVPKFVPKATAPKAVSPIRKSSVKATPKVLKAGTLPNKSSLAGTTKVSGYSAPKTNQATSQVNSQNNHNHQSNTLAINAWLDRAGNNPKYKIAEEMVVNVSANIDCNIVVFNYDSQGVLTQIFPNDYQPSGIVRAGETIQIGGPDSSFKYEISGNGGPEKVFVYSYPIDEKQPLQVAMNPVPNTPFRSTEMTAEKYRELVNGSKVFFSRGVKVMPRPTAQGYTQVMTAASTKVIASPNKIELPFTVVAPGN